MSVLADHDHGLCRDSALSRAERRCRTRGVRFTPQRRRVFEALLMSHVPASAYDIADRLAAEGPPLAPISVYRALDFLVGQGLAHRIESRNAFLACTQDRHEAGVVFLLCESCGTAEEADSAEVERLISRVAGEAGFTPRGAVVEVRGLCTACGADKPAKRGTSA